MKTLEFSLDHISDQLISIDQKKQIIDCASDFPSQAANFYGFETVLCNDDALVDFAFNLTNNGNKWLSSNHHEHYPKLKRLCKNWGSSSNVPFSDGANIWLEFDTSNEMCIEQEPSIFLAFTDMEALRAGHHAKKRNIQWIKDKLLKDIVAQDAVDAIAHQLSLCLQCLPEHTQKIQLGFMLSRSFPAIRLCIFNFTGSNIQPFLEQITWKGDLEKVLSITKKYSPWCDSFCIHLDIGAKLYPTLGLELIHEGEHPWQWQPAFNDNWEHIFNQLQMDGFCTPQKARVLLALPKKKTISVPLIEKLINRSFINDGRLLDTIDDGVLTLGIQHIKFKLDVQGNVCVKGYFGGQFEEAATIHPTHLKPITDDVHY